MNVAVVYIGKDDKTEKLAEDMAIYAGTNITLVNEFDFRQRVDLLMIGFNEKLVGKPKDVISFINKLDRKYIKNLALFSTFKVSQKSSVQVLRACQNNDLPLMRQSYTVKMPLVHSHLTEDILEGGRVFMYDMMTIVNNYY